MDKKRKFSVRIKYREPNFEERIGPLKDPFSYTYIIHAFDKAEAIALAEKEFHAVARLSSVSWVRNIVSIETVEADASAEIAREAGMSTEGSRDNS